MATPTSSVFFYTIKVRTVLAWWNQPEKYAPTKVLQYLRHGVKIKFDRPIQPLKLATHLISESKDIDFVIKDLTKDRQCGAYVELVVGGASFLSRSRVYTPASGKQRMVHALCGLNVVTTKRPCKYELIHDLPVVFRPVDWMLLVDAKAVFWSVSIHPQSRKFMSSHYALPTFYESEGKTTFVSLQSGDYWAL